MGKSRQSKKDHAAPEPAKSADKGADKNANKPGEKGNDKNSDKTASDKPADSKSKAAKSGPNTKAQAYIDKFNTASECQDNKAAIKEHCKPGPERTEAEKAKGPAKKTGVMEVVSKAAHSLDTLGRVNYQRNDANAWLDTHCDFMWTKPMSLKDQAKHIEELTNALEKLQGEKWTLAKHAMKELGDRAVAKAGDAAKQKLEALAARTVAKHVVGGAAVIGTAGTVGDIVEIGMIAWSAKDMLDTARELAKLLGEEGAMLLENLENSLNIKDKMKAMLKDLKDNPDKAMADAMELAGKFNKCLRAKRCQLVAMAQTSAPKAKANGMGCCPGQTGHHLLPREMFRRKVEVVVPAQGNQPASKKWEDDKDECKEYTDSMHNNAPVVCVEGTNQNTASHGVIHGKIDGLMKEHKKLHGDQISNTDAIEAAIKSHQETFKSSCNPDCLREQLKTYYSTLCSGKMKPRGGTGKDTEDKAKETDNGKDTD